MFLMNSLSDKDWTFVFNFCFSVSLYEWQGCMKHDIWNETRLSLQESGKLSKSYVWWITTISSQV
jgi:hypothetical protein